MKMLITGGAGFVGSHLCEKYVKDGHKVFCLDNFSNSNLHNIRGLLNYPNFKLIKGDIRDRDLLEKIIPEVDVIMHLAAQIHVDKSIVEPRETYDVNVIGTLNILESVRRHDTKKVIFASTSEVYGTAQTHRMDESHPLLPQHPYGASKAGADRMCYGYNRTYGLDINIIRPFNIFGPRQRDSGYGGVISIFMKRILDGKPPIIYGDGTQTRDYTFVEDTVNAYDLVLNAKKLKTPINFGSGAEIKILDLANKIIEMTDNKGKIEPVFVDPRPGEVMRLCADISRAKKELGFEPKFSLDKGLEKLLKWYQGQKQEMWKH